MGFKENGIDDWCLADYSPLSTPSGENAPPANLVWLHEEKGRASLQAALANADGKTAIFVHPYFPERADTGNILETNNCEKIAYEEYQEKLLKAGKVYARKKLPIILFEEARVVFDGREMKKELGRMGLENETVFAVPTFSGSPRPLPYAFGEPPEYNAFGRLHALGIRRATVGGSYLGTEQSLFLSSDRTSPVHTFSLCVGAVINNLYSRDVKVTAGYATYPKKRWARGTHHIYK